VSDIDNKQLRVDSGGLLVCIGNRRTACGREVAEFLDASRLHDTGFGNRIGAYRRKQNISVAVLAKRAGVSREFVETAEDRPWDVPFVALQAIASVLGRNLDDFSESDIVLIDGAGNQ